MRCAAANDDSDEEDLGTLTSASRRPRTNASGVRVEEQSSVASSSGAKDPQPEGQGKRRKKEKAFAWMDSEDDGDEDDPEVAEDAGKEKQDASEEEEDTVSVEALDGVQSFGRMMLLEPSLRKRLRDSVDAELVAAACRALGRTKFFDGDLLEDLYEVLKSLLSTNRFSAMQTTDVLICLKDLNAYNRKVCTAIARGFASRVADLEPGMRAFWLEAFKAFNHTAEPDFVQLLETPGVAPTHPNYRKLRCLHFSRGSCALGSTCSFSHDPRAPLSLTDGVKEDWWKYKASIMMTQDQRNLGQGSYGTGRLGVNPM